MLRVVVAVALSVALLAVSLPALETARRDHSHQRVGAELDRLATAIRDVHAREAAVRDESASTRRVVTLRLPARAWTDAGIDFVAIGGTPDRPPTSEREAPTFVWQVSGGQREKRELRAIHVEVRTQRNGDGPLVVREPGTHRLAVSLVAHANRTVVVVRRLQ